MTGQILSTKLSIPTLRSRVVLRPRLLQKLSQGLECGFVLVSAPAGYGKSTLLSTWLSKMEYPAAWLTLDVRDNDPLRFLAYLTAACRSIEPSVAEMADSMVRLDSPSELETLLIPLVNHLALAKSPFCLVLDDYHTIQNQLVHQAVTFLLEHRPEALHLVITTRADPPLPLAKLRSRSDMLELRMADLRFTPQEAADFLNHTMGLRVSAEDVARITRRTEGWIAGLQMAALSMQNCDDISGFINSISGSQHYIFDYLLDEVLGRQSAEIQSFLLRTCVLDQLCAPLCDALLEGSEDSAPHRPSSVLLEELEHANLFIIPMDHEQRWYRYHPLFAELLRSYLQTNSPGQISDLHIRASAWYEQQGFIAESISHSFSARDWERAVRLISANIFALLEQNELTSVTRQLESMTYKTKSARPWLLIGRAWLAAYTGQLNSAENVLKLAEAQFDNLNSEVELQTLGGHIAAIRAYTNWIMDKREIAIEAAKAALEWLPPDETTMRCQAATLLGLAHRELYGSARAFELALEYARRSSVSHVTIFAYGCYAWMLAMQGRLHEAVVVCREAIQLSRSGSGTRLLPTLSHVYTTLSFALLEWNDLENALYYSKEAVSLARHWEQADALHFALDQLGSVLFALGDIEGAFDLLNQAWQVAQRTSHWFEEITISREVEWHLTQHDLEAALARLRQAQIDLETPFAAHLELQKSKVIYVTLVEVYLAQKQFSKALALASELTQDQEKKNIGYFLIRSLITQALAYHGLKQEHQAQATLSRALTLAAPEGYIRTFIRWRAELLPLLHHARTAGITPEYIDLILAAFELDTKRQQVSPAVSPDWVERLSEREMDVLKLLAQGCSDKKIAESLVIARETVHKHLKNIYGKLGVHSRTEAVARAHQLSLL